MPDSYPKKYWWVAVALVPLGAALIAILPDLISDSGDSGGSGKEASNSISLDNSTVAGDVQIIGTQVILQQVGAGKSEVEVKELKDKLERATNLAQGQFYKDAIPLFKELASELNSPAVYANLGALYIVEGQYDQARDALKEGVAIDSKYQPLHVNLARVYQQQGETQKALRQLEQAPDNPQAKLLLHELQRQLAGGFVEQEPNDDIFTPNALPIGKHVDGTIGANSGADFFRFDAPGPPRDLVRVMLINRSTSLKPRLNLWSAEKKHLWANATYGHQVTAGQDVSRVFSLQPGATYFVSVQPISGTGKYQILVEPLTAYDRFEPNDDILNAKPIDIGKTIDASLLDDSDVDFYQIRSPATVVHVALRNTTTPGFKSRLEIWAANKRHIWRNATYGHQVTTGQDVETQIKGNADAVYFVSVGSLGGAGDYTLTVTAP